MELARVEEIGGLDEGPIRERADNDARRPEHAEDREGYPPSLHKVEDENADKGSRAHREDRFNPLQIESTRHISDEETASAELGQYADDTSALRFYVVPPGKR